jgi:hypothetical protein
MIHSLGFDRTYGGQAPKWDLPIIAHVPQPSSFNYRGELCFRSTSRLSTYRMAMGRPATAPAKPRPRCSGMHRFRQHRSHPDKHHGLLRGRRGLRKCVWWSDHRSVTFNREPDCVFHPVMRLVFRWWHPTPSQNGVERSRNIGALRPPSCAS